MSYLPQHSRHHDVIKNAIPKWLTDASPQRIRGLKRSAANRPHWASMASASAQGLLQLAIQESWRSLSVVDQMFSALQDVYSFAQPLLRQALKDNYGVDVDTRETFVKLYSPAKLSPWIINVTGGVSTRTVSLLDAALLNFSSNESLLADSQFISRPDARGQFDIKPMGRQITVEQFKALCRELDIGARYKNYLEDYLLPADGLARGVLHHRIIDNQQKALNAAAHLALMKKELGHEAFQVVQGFIKRTHGLRLDGIPVRYYHLTALGTRLCGIVLIAADLDASSAGTRRVIAYVPQDPEHPLKEYPSLAQFCVELVRQLRGSSATTSGRDYQAFFSRFVDYSQRGVFAPTLSQRLASDGNPRLQLGVVAFAGDTANRFNGDVWDYLYRLQQSKILNDARAMVVSTADADSAQRWAWVENVEKMLSDLLNVALMVVTPFIPGLGEVMMGYMVYQLLNEVVEGVVELAEGLYLDAAGHLIDFTESLVQLAAFGAGMHIVGGTVVPKLSAFIEGTLPVELPDGTKRLWGRNLEPYQRHDLLLAADSKPDASGLYQHQGKPVLRLDTRHFELNKHPVTGKHRLRHPSRPQAYEPHVASNGAGAFLIEGEQPQLWEENRLMARLGPRMADLDDAYADIRSVSRVDAAAIRQMYIGNERAFPTLSDTVTRFAIDRDIQTFIEQIGSDHSQVYQQADPALQFLLLDGVWPGRSVELVDASGEVLQVIGATHTSPLRIRTDQLVDNDLLKTLLSHLDQHQTKTLMSLEFGEPVASSEANAQRLRVRLAQSAEHRRTSLFNYRYQRAQANLQAVHGDARALQACVPDLPGSVAQALLAHTTPTELQAIRRGELSARLNNLARWALQDVNVCRAYEGLYLQSVDNPATRRLALHSLENLPGWNPEVRIEVVRFGYGGHLLDSIGPAESRIGRTVVEREDLTFESYDQQGRFLHWSKDFYSSILQALPDAERTGLNIHIGQGPALKSLVREYALTPYRVRNLLADLPVLKPLTFDPRVMRLRGGAPSPGNEQSDLLQIAQRYPELVAGAFHPSVSPYEQFDYLRGLQLMHEAFPDEFFEALWRALYDANVLADVRANLDTVNSIGVLPDLKKLMAPEQFDALVERLFTDTGLVPLTEFEQNLGANARNLEQTGRFGDYERLVLEQRESATQVFEPLVQLSGYSESLSVDTVMSDEPVEVSPLTMADLQLAQRAIYRTKELLPLSGNQLASIWQKGGSAIAKIKGLRELNLQEGGFTAKLTTVQAARKAIEIKGGNCAENSKVTFAVLASQPRRSSIHIVKATDFDHQYVVIGDDLSDLDQLVVADSWPEFPAAHLASNGYFQFELPPVLTLRAGPAVADYAFIHDAPPGPATIIPASEENTFRQIKINKLYKSGAYAQFTSLNTLGTTYRVAGATPVSFERLPMSVVDDRLDAWLRYLDAFKALLETPQ